MMAKYGVPTGNFARQAYQKVDAQTASPGQILLKLYEGAIRFTKQAKQAIEDGDPIQAVILGSAVNNDGRTIGLTTPNLQAQKAVLESAYARAGIRPGTIGYLEANGTGNLVGDPIEIQAATHCKIFQKQSN